MDHVLYSDDLLTFFRDRSVNDPQTLLVLSGVNTDSNLPTLEANFEGKEQKKI